MNNEVKALLERISTGKVEYMSHSNPYIHSDCVKQDKNHPFTIYYDPRADKGCLSIEVCGIVLLCITATEYSHICILWDRADEVAFKYRDAVIRIHFAV